MIKSENFYIFLADHHFEKEEGRHFKPNDVKKSICGNPNSHSLDFKISRDNVKTRLQLRGMCYRRNIVGVFSAKSRNPKYIILKWIDLQFYFIGIFQNFRADWLQSIKNYDKSIHQINCYSRSFEPIDQKVCITHQNLAPNCLKEDSYRTIDGTCNNQENTFWGAAETPFARLLQPAYDDGKNDLKFFSISSKHLFISCV